MYAYEIPGLRFSLPAGGTVNRCRFVSVASEAGIQATASTKVIGASMNEVTSGKVLEIADGIVMVTADAAITSGVEVASDADGKAVTFVSGTTGAACGTAITAATASGQLIAVKIH